MPNGILVNYTVLLGDAVVIATLPTVLSYNVTELSPFTSYNLSVLACTSVDCVESPSLQATTQEDGELFNMCSLFNIKVCAIIIMYLQPCEKRLAQTDIVSF